MLVNLRKGPLIQKRKLTKQENFDEAEIERPKKSQIRSMEEN